MKKKTLKIIGAVVGGVIVVIVIVVVAAWERILPVVIRARMESEIADVWKGPVRVEGVRMGYGGELKVRQIELGDKAGRGWVDVQGLKVGLENWPSLSPEVRAVDVNGLYIELYFAEGKMAMPLEMPERKKAAERKEGMHIPDINIADSSLTLSSEGGAKVVYDKMRLTIAEADGVANVSFLKERTGTGEELSLKGTINKETGDADIVLKLAHRITEEETAIVLGVLAPKGGWRGSGELNADCRIQGAIVARHNMTMEGQAAISGGSVSNATGEFARDINARADIKGQRVDVRELSATVAGGKLTGTLFADHVLAYPIDYGGDVRAENIDIPKLAAALGSTSKVTKGTAGGQFAFTGTSKSIDDLNGNLGVNLHGAELTVLPAVALVFKTIGLARFDPSAATDAEGKFKVNGAALTVEDAQVSSTLGAIKAEPGGTYNVQTKDIDAYAVAVPLEQVQEAIERVPVGDILMKFKDRLVRVHLKGNLNEPDKLVSSEPLKGIGEGAGDVLRGATEAGKNVGEGA